MGRTTGPTKPPPPGRHTRGDVSGTASPLGATAHPLVPSTTGTALDNTCTPIRNGAANTTAQNVYAASIGQHVVGKPRHAEGYIKPPSDHTFVATDWAERVRRNGLNGLDVSKITRENDHVYGEKNVPRRTIMQFMSTYLVTHGPWQILTNKASTSERMTIHKGAIHPWAGLVIILYPRPGTPRVTLMFQGQRPHRALNAWRAFLNAYSNLSIEHRNQIPRADGIPTTYEDELGTNETVQPETTPPEMEGTGFEFTNDDPPPPPPPPPPDPKPSTESLDLTHHR